jgi:integrase
MEYRSVFQETIPESQLFDVEEDIFGSHPIVAPSYGIPKFGDAEKWQLAAAGVAPNLSLSNATLNFKRFTGVWNLRARELAMIMLNPNHPQLIPLGLGGRRVPKIRHVLATINGTLWSIYRWAIESDTPLELKNWTPAHADAFLTSALSERKPASVHAEVGTYRLLHTFREALTGGGIQVPPWPENLSNARIAGYRVGTDLKTEPMSPEEWATVVHAAWTYVAKFEPDIRAARERIMKPYADEHMEQARARELVSRWLSGSETQIPIREVSLHAQALRGEVDYQRILTEATGYRWRMPKATVGSDLDTKIQDLIACGRTQGPPPIKYKLKTATGKLVPWRSPLESPRDVRAEDAQLRLAGYLIISALTLMRDSEIQGLRRGSVVMHYGSPALASKVVKHNRNDEQRYWWAADAVLKTVEVLEAQHDGEWLFGVFKNHSEDRGTKPPRMTIRNDIRRFVEHINANHEYWNMAPIKTSVNSRRLRRTMAIIAGSGIDGPVSVSLQLKHATKYAIANRLSSAYAAPDRAWLELFEKSQREATALFFKDLHNTATNNSSTPTGPGASRALEVAKTLGSSAFKGVVDDGSIKRTLGELGLANIREGPISYCLGDPNEALCLSPAEKARGDEPNPMKCMPDRCRNSFVYGAKQKQVKNELSLVKNKLKQSSSEQTTTILKERVNELERLLERGEKSGQSSQ